MFGLVHLPKTTFNSVFLCFSRLPVDQDSRPTDHSPVDNTSSLWLSLADNTSSLRLRPLLRDRVSRSSRLGCVPREWSQLGRQELTSTWGLGPESR